MIPNVAQRRLVAARAALPPPARLLLAGLGVMNLGVLAPLPALRAMATLPLVLLVPGYAVMMAVFGHRPRRDVLLTLAFTVLLSMATYPLVALALYAASIPIRTGSVMLSTDGLVALLVAMAVLRTRRERRITTVSVVPCVTTTGLRSPWNGARGGMLFAALVAIAIAALAAALPLWPAPTDQPYTQFYLAGPWAHLSTMVQVRPNQRLAVELGITNQTHRRQRYQIVPRLAGGPSWPERTVTVPAGRSWAGSMSGYVPPDGCVHRLSIALRVGRNGKALSPLTLWVRAAPGRLSPAAPLRAAHAARVAPLRGRRPRVGEAHEAGGHGAGCLSPGMTMSRPGGTP
jgi:uncharacterized membrane protein